MPSGHFQTSHLIGRRESAIWFVDWGLFEKHFQQAIQFENALYDEK